MTSCFRQPEKWMRKERLEKRSTRLMVKLAGRLLACLRDKRESVRERGLGLGSRESETQGFRRKVIKKQHWKGSFVPGCG